MKRKISLLALGAFALLPLSLSQPAAAYDYYRSGLERHIDHDRADLQRDHSKREYLAEREHLAARNGHWWAADWFRWRKHNVDHRIDRERSDLHHDYRVLEHRGY